MPKDKKTGLPRKGTIAHKKGEALPTLQGAGSTPIHYGSLRAVGRNFVDRLRQLGASGQKKERQRLTHLLRAAEKFSGPKKKDSKPKLVLLPSSDRQRLAASKHFSTDFEGRVYSILFEKRNLSHQEGRKAQSDMKRVSKFRQSVEQKAATERTG